MNTPLTPSPPLPRALSLTHTRALSLSACTPRVTSSLSPRAAVLSEAAGRVSTLVVPPFFKNQYIFISFFGGVGAEFSPRGNDGGMKKLDTRGR